MLVECFVRTAFKTLDEQPRTLFGVGFRDARAIYIGSSFNRLATSITNSEGPFSKRLP